MTVGGSSYSYDGDGNRVTKNDGGGTTLYWPSGVMGVVDVSNATATSFGLQVFLDGLRIWSEDVSGTGRFLFQDQLGSTRVTASAAGQVEDDIDYRSFGEIVANYGAAPSDTPELGAVEQPGVPNDERVWNEWPTAMRRENTGVYRLLCVNVRGISG